MSTRYMMVGAIKGELFYWEIVRSKKALRRLLRQFDAMGCTVCRKMTMYESKRGRLRTRNVAVAEVAQ